MASVMPSLGSSTSLSLGFHRPLLDRETMEVVAFLLLLGNTPSCVRREGTSIYGLPIFSGGGVGEGVALCSISYMSLHLPQRSFFLPSLDD